MPFQDLDSLESQRTTMRRDEDPQYSDDPAFDRLAESLGEQIQLLVANTANLDRQIALLGTKRDNPRLRERIQNVLEETVAGLKAAGEGFQKIKTWEYVNSTQKMTQTKLVAQHRSVLVEFETVNRRHAAKEREISMAAQAAIENDGHSYDDSDLQLQEQQLMQPQLANQNEVDFQQRLINERGEQIEGVNQTVGELGALWVQLGDIISKQGEQLGTIEQNVERTTDSTQGANTELRSASRYQKNARTTACCLFIILAIILTIIVLAVVLG